MKINQMLIPKSKTKTRPGRKMTPKYITIHETGNTNKGANAHAHARLQYNGNSRQASWHFQVDDKEIWQSLPTNEVGWHAGDGQGPGNMLSIGIEICVNSDGNFAKARAHAAWLAAKLMKDHKIPLKNVVQHNKWSGKNCPQKIRSGGLWGSFIKQVEEEYKKMTAPQEDYSYLNPAPNGAKFTRTLRYIEGNQMIGNDVLAVQQFLGVAPAKDKNGKPYGIYGPKTHQAVLEYRLKMGAKERTGSVGPWTWEKMFGRVKKEEPKPAPKPDPAPAKTRFRVVAGSYAARENAEAQLKRLKAAGFEAFILPVE